MDEEPNLFNKIAVVLDQNIRIVQIGVYSVALTGLAVALHSVRPFSRFRKPTDVPQHFFESRTKLRGKVLRIEPNGALLMVQHKPLICLGRSKGECLPVKIAGVNITGNGISWLQTIVAGQEISLIPVTKKRDWLGCEVTLSKILKNKKIQQINLGPALIEVGFASIAPIEKSLSSDINHQQYYRLLNAAEKTALKKNLGVWYYVQPTKEITLALVNKIMTVFKANSKQKTKAVKITTS